jgi:hypothetical protein
MFSLNSNNIASNTDITLETVDVIEQSNVQYHKDHVRVINSNQGMNDHDPDFFGSAFPELFPYGVGSPNQHRPLPVSFELGLKHLLKLRDRRFAQHSCFPLIAFDMIARRKGNVMLSLRLKKIPEMAPNSVTVTKEELVGLLKYNHEKMRALKAGRTVPELPPSLASGPVNMLKAVEHCARHSYGTNEERVAMGHKVDAYCQQFGRPHLMVTMSPLTDNQFVVAVRSASLDDDGIHASCLLDAFDHKDADGNEVKAKPLPSAKSIQEACVKDPVAAAEYFDKMSNFFIEKILGWDPKTHRSVKEGGLFGYPQAYAAGIETQGCSLLHFHMLVWLENMPHTGVEEDNYDDFNQHLAAYVDSIVTTDLPINDLFRFPLTKEEIDAATSEAHAANEIGEVDATAETKVIL